MAKKDTFKYEKENMLSLTKCENKFKDEVNNLIMSKFNIVMI